MLYDVMIPILSYVAGAWSAILWSKSASGEAPKTFKVTKETLPLVGGKVLMREGTKMAVFRTLARDREIMDPRFPTRTVRTGPAIFLCLQGQESYARALEEGTWMSPAEFWPEVREYNGMPVEIVP